MLATLLYLVTWFAIHRYTNIHSYASTCTCLYTIFSFSDLDSIVLCQNGGGFLIQANTQKRQKLQEDDNSNVFERVEVCSCLMS